MPKEPITVQPSKDQLWEELDFCIAHFPDLCRREVYAVQYDHSFKHFHLRDSYDTFARLPIGWSSTEIAVFRSRINEGGHEINRWGFVTILGPREMIEKLKTLENNRRAANLAVVEFMKENVIAQYYEMGRIQRSTDIHKSEAY